MGSRRLLITHCGSSLSDLTTSLRNVVCQAWPARVLPRDLCELSNVVNCIIAQAFAAQEGIALTDAHWEVLSLLRSYFEAFGDSPANRALVNYTKQQLGAEKGNSLYLMGLFPGSPARVGSRISGLPKPKNCL